MNTDNNQEFEALCARLLPKFNEYLQRHSKNVFSCELATSLEGISSMPALYDLHGVRKQVIAPLHLLTKNVDEKILEAENATAAAKTAAVRANAAADSVTQATTDLTAEKQKVADTVSASESQTAAAKAATNDTITAKAAIEKNEDGRISAEQARQQAESARNSAEKKRISAETQRSSAETQRAAAEQQRIEDTLTALTESETQTNLAQELNDHPPKMGDNGNWWQWSLATHAYVDTGVIARGGAMYPSFRQRRNKLLMIDYGSHVAERAFKRRNKLIIKV